MIKMQLSNLVRTARLWNKLHQVSKKSKNQKIKKLQSQIIFILVLGAMKQEAKNRLLVLLII
jgi:hypothetical protein